MERRRMSKARARGRVRVLGILLGFSLFASWGIAPIATADFKGSVDGTFAAISLEDINVKARTHLGFGGGRFSFGPLVYYEHPHAYAHDVGGGLMLRWGGQLHVSLEGGALYRRVFDVKTRGWFLGPTLGYELVKNFRISVPLIFKRAGRSMRDGVWTFYPMPYVGMQWGY